MTVPREVPATAGELAGRRVAVMGLGRSGVALARVLHRLGARVFLSDSRPEELLAEPLGALRDLPLERETGGHTERLLVDRDLVVLSPGVSVHHPLVRQALERGVPVMGEVEVAWLLSSCPFAAVTGTKGKSTTATLIHRMLGPPAVLAGNIGIPLVAQVDRLSEGTWVVAEISSFQLEAVHRFHPRVAVLTNLGADHLDRHLSLAEYRAAKARLFARMGPGDVAVISADDPGAAELAEDLEQGRLPEWRLPGFPRPSAPPAPEILRFSVEGPVEAGAWLEGGTVWFRRGGAAERLFTWDFPGLPGRHNRANALAAVAVGRVLGREATALRRALEEHRPLPHRFQEVGRKEGVRFVNDSAATNPGAVEAALDACPEPVVLIAGGKDKGADFSALGRRIARRVVHLVLLGETSQRLEAAVREAGLSSISRAATLEEAVREAWRWARPRGVVLLSPGSASQDMFRDAEERGDRFIRAVAALEAEMVGS